MRYISYSANALRREQVLSARMQNMPAPSLRTEHHTLCYPLGCADIHMLPLLSSARQGLSEYIP